MSLRGGVLDDAAISTPHVLLCKPALMIETLRRGRDPVIARRSPRRRGNLQVRASFHRCLRGYMTTRFLDRLKAAYGRIQPSVAMDILIYSPDELDDLCETSALVSHALEKGRVLYAA